MAEFTVNISSVKNQPPNAVGINSISLANGEDYTFNLADFTTNTTPAYSDPEGDDALNIKILYSSISSGYGNLYLNDVILYGLSPVVISLNDIDNGLFKYIQGIVLESSFSVLFNFSISDTESMEYTSGGVFTINVGTYSNSAPTVGDGSISIDGIDNYTFTRSDFTLNTDPPYYDFEGDIASDLKILEIPATGLLKLNGVSVVNDDIISFDDIDDGLFIYDPETNSGGTIPNFTFEISDKGSGIFVG